MAILEVRPARARNLIGWFGELPELEIIATFERNGFLLQAYTEADLDTPTTLSTLSAIVFVQSPMKPNRIVRSLANHGHALLNHGCQVVVMVAAAHPTTGGGFKSFAAPLATVLRDHRFPAAGLSVFSDEELKTARGKPGNEPPLPHVRFFPLGTSWDWVANSIAATDQDGSPSTVLEIAHPKHVHLNDAHQLLLRRAFSDCKTVHLAPMDEEGKSGALVFRAYADLARGLLGPWPQPYFVKLGPRNKIFREYQNYMEVVDPYVPFHLGPRLIPRRCHLGSKLGIVVGDFVERAESLRDCAKRGRAAPAIAALFHTTLHGWYRTALDKDIPLTDRLSLPRLDCVPRRLTQARRMGARMDLAALNKQFQSSATLLPLLMGPIHGDLHASNILVRANDAILIDFYAHRDDMPILFDIACLEASLLLDGFGSDDRKVLTWLRSIAPLYKGALLESACATVHPKDASAWFFACVNQIRLFARDTQRCPGQYAAILAVALLRKASKDASLKGKQSIRRAAAFVLAEQLLEGAFGGGESNIPSHRGAKLDHQAADAMAGPVSA